MSNKFPVANNKLQRTLYLIYIFHLLQLLMHNLYCLLLCDSFCNMERTSCFGCITRISVEF